jgi:hypothetical protein
MRVRPRILRKCYMSIRTHREHQFANYREHSFAWNREHFFVLMRIGVHYKKLMLQCTSTPSNKFFRMI